MAYEAHGNILLNQGPALGTASVPDILFLNSSISGFFLKSNGVIGVSIAGTEVFNFSASGGSESGPLTITGILDVGVGSASTANVINVIGPTSVALAGVGQSGFNVGSAFNTTGATGGIHGFRSAVIGTAGAYVTANVDSFRAVNPVAGAGQTMTRVIGGYFDMPTGGGTGNAILSDNILFTGSFGLNLATASPSSFTGALCTVRANVASTATIASLASASSYVKLTGSTATDLQGIAAGINGQKLVLVNLTGQNLTIRNQSASAASGAKITTLTGADVVTTGNGSAEFIYDTDASPAEWTCIFTTL